MTDPAEPATLQERMAKLREELAMASVMQVKMLQESMAQTRSLALQVADGEDTFAGAKARAKLLADYLITEMHTLQAMMDRPQARAA